MASYSPGSYCPLSVPSPFVHPIAVYYAYMIECKGKDGTLSLYTGYTNSIERRFAEHVTSRGARYTRGKSLRLVFFQAFRTQVDAMRREREIKTLSKPKKIAIINDAGVNEHLLRT
jgi:putative endonuclease